MQQHHDRVALMIKILKSLSISWPYAQVVLPQLKKVAAEVFFGRSEQQENALAERNNGTNAEVENSWLDALDIQILQNIMTFDMPAVGAAAG